MNNGYVEWLKSRKPGLYVEFVEWCKTHGQQLEDAALICFFVKKVESK